MEQDDNDKEREQELESPELPNEAFGELGSTIEDAAAAMEAAQPGEFINDDGTSVDDAAAADLDVPQSADEPAKDAIADITPGTEATATQTFDRGAEERDRLNHPSRYSPVTGERAPPNHFYLPWKPPAAPAHGLPIGNAATPVAAPSEVDAAEADAANPTPMPPAVSLGFSHEVAKSRQGSILVQPVVEAPAPREDIGQPLPRVLVTVSLAATRNLFDDALEDATRQMAERFRKLALNEIDRAAFLRRAAERAADYSLRGPVF